MKYITLIIGLLVVGCGTPKQTDTNESTPTTNTNKVDGTTEKPVKELTPEQKGLGTYELKIDGITLRFVILETGIVEKYINGKKHEEEGKWKIVEGQIHIIDGQGKIDVLRINKDNSITNIASIRNGKRIDVPKEEQLTVKKIK